MTQQTILPTVTNSKHIHKMTFLGVLFLKEFSRVYFPFLANRSVTKHFSGNLFEDFPDERLAELDLFLQKKKIPSLAKVSRKK